MKSGARTIVVLAAAVLGFSLTGCGTTTTVTPADLSAMTTAQMQAYVATLTPDQLQTYAGSMTPAQLQSFAAALTPAQIQTVAGSLTLAQLQAITPYLTMVSGTTGTTGTTTVPDGATLYATNCAGCHGPLATSTKLGATAAQIQTAITSNTGGMGQFANSLTASQVQAIATALAVPATGTTTGTTGGTTSGTTTTAPDGATLYANNCAGCHGPLATSTKLGATAAQIQSAIGSNTGGMGSFATLTAADIQAIATALSGSATGTTTATAALDGASLFTAYCSSCHGSMGSQSVSSIQSAIRSQSRMSSLAALTTAQLQAISDYLSSSGGGSGGGD